MVLWLMVQVQTSRSTERSGNIVDTDRQQRLRYDITCHGLRRHQRRRVLYTIVHTIMMYAAVQALVVTLV